MKDSRFFDTNIIAYAFDRSDPEKRKVCSRLVKEAFDGVTRGSVSNQVLAELFVVLTQKVARPVSKARASTILRSFVDSPNWVKVNYEAGTAARAAGDSAAMANHFWDLLIAETMRDAGVRKIYSENAKDFEGVSWIEATDPIEAERRAAKARAGAPRK